MIRSTIALFRAVKHSSIFLVEFAYHILLSDTDNKKNLIFATTLNYLVIMWLLERLQMV